MVIFPKLQKNLGKRKLGLWTITRFYKGVWEEVKTIYDVL